MSTYGKKMLYAALKIPRATRSTTKPHLPPLEENRQSRVSNWISSIEHNDDISCDEYMPSDISDSDSEYIPPSVSSQSGSTEYPSLKYNIAKGPSSTSNSTLRPYEASEQLLSSEPTHIPDLCPTKAVSIKAIEQGSTSSSTMRPCEATELSNEHTPDSCPTKAELSKAFEKVSVAGDAKIGSKRNYRKPDYCFFCKGMYGSKISKHYMTVHENEPRVQEIMKLACGSRERKRLWTLLQNEGNHLHNCMVLQNGYGELTVARRPCTEDGGARAENYLPCVNCKAWLFKKNLSLHSKNCPSGKMADANFCRNSQMLLSPFLKLNNDDVDIDNIFSHLKETTKNPGLKTVCKQDNLIKEFCRGLVHKIGTKGEQRRKDKDNIRTKVRAVSRLLLNLNEANNESLSLDEYFKPKTFMLMVNVVKKMGMTSPNLSLTLGHYIKQICQLKKSVALQNEDNERRKQADDFDLLYHAHWNSYVSSVALRRQKLRSLNKVHDLPLTSDLVKLKTFLDEKIQQFLDKFQHSHEEWIDAAQAVMVRLILFNKRRVSEVEELKNTDVTENQTSSESEDILAQMDVTEKALAKRMKVVEVRGKSTRGLRKVFIILSEQMNKACLHLITTRLHAGISISNPYMFARSKNSPLDGCQAMRTMSERCPELEYPQRIRTRLLRKYLATTVQILDMTGDELKMVADHMGHSVSVHTDVYRLQSSLLEKTKVARALMALENGQMSRFSGRTLASCTLEEIPIVAEDDPDDGDDMCVTQDPEACNNGVESIHPIEEVTRKRSEDDEKESGPSKSKRSTIRSRQRWTVEEDKILMQSFREDFESKTSPTSDQIRKVQEKHECLKLRSIATIKSKINNVNLGKCKLQI